MHDIIIPPRKTPENESGYFEILTKAVFQAGFSWKVVEAKWFGFREIFVNFDFKTIADWDQEHVLQALESSLIIRNIRKIEATIFNAKQFIKLAEIHGSFKKYIESFRDESYSHKVKTLSKEFKWLGKTGCFFFFYSINEDVPDWLNR